MQTRIGWLALLTVGMAAAPTVVWGQQPTDNLPPLLVPWQLVAPGSAGDSSGGSFVPPTAVRGQQLDYEVPQADPVFPIPTYSPKPELGGFFFDSEFRYMQQTNPVKNQLLAVRGFVNSDGASPIPQPVGTFNGNAFTALNANMVDGPLTFIPGYSFGLGYRFRDGLQVEVNYWHLFNVRYVSGASLLPPANQVDPNLANTFLFSPVYNFTADWAGPNVATTAPGANPLGNFGIWNGASEMDLQFDQRLEKYEIMFRYPIWESEYDPISNQDHYAIRTYGQVGVRHYWEWEKFWWRVVHADSQGNSGPTDVAEYSNILSQELYGPSIAYGFEFYAGHGFSVSLDTYASLYMDFGRSYIKWVRGDDGTEAKVSRKIFTPVPETEADLNLWWYPIEGVQIRVGYDFIALYNMFYDKQEVASTGTYTPPASFIPGVTTAAQGSQPGVPILGLGNFNFQSLNTPIGHDIRFIQGLHVGIGFIF